MAKNGFVLCDLDLVLTEYYDKREKSQIRYWEIQTNEDNFIEFIVLNISNLLTFSDWIPAAMTLFMKLFYAISTTLSSKLSLLSNLNQPMPSICYYHNHIYSFFQLFVSKFLSFYLSPCTRNINQGVMATNTINT